PLHDALPISPASSSGCGAATPAVEARTAIEKMVAIRIRRFTVDLRMLQQGSGWAYLECSMRNSSDPEGLSRSGGSCFARHFFQAVPGPRRRGFAEGLLGEHLKTGSPGDPRRKR